MRYILIITLFFSSAASAGAYFGLNYGYTGYTSDALEKYKVSPKGATYGGFFGYGRNALGLEFIYQSLSAQGPIKHDGEKQTINENATAMGGAVRLSFSSFYFRGGLASYQLDQGVDISNAASRATAEDVYDVRKKGARQSGSLFGVGVHTNWGPKILPKTLFVDFTRYQVGDVGHYDAFSVGISFLISDKHLRLK